MNFSMVLKFKRFNKLLKDLLKHSSHIGYFCVCMYVDNLQPQRFSHSINTLPVSGHLLPTINYIV